MSTPDPTPTSPIYKLACNFFRAMDNKDFASAGSLLAPDFSHQMWPSTMRGGAPATMRAPKDVWMDRQAQFQEGFINAFNFDIDHPVNVVEGTDTIVIQLSSQGLLRNDKPNNQEYLFILRFDADHKVVKIDEWIDSAYAFQVFGEGMRPETGPDGRISNVEEAKKNFLASK